MLNVHSARSSARKISTPVGVPLVCSSVSSFASRFDAMRMIAKGYEMDEDQRKGGVDGELSAIAVGAPLGTA